MADFVAVIRRAVDGLANNTPEMRTKVYEKARGAVQRQLENMKPRPSDDMLRRQMDKLETAILEVESEHAEALPPAEEPVADFVEAPAAQAAYPAAFETAPQEEEPAAREQPSVAPEPSAAHEEAPAYEEPPAAYEQPARYDEEPVAPASYEEQREELAADENIPAPAEAYEPSGQAEPDAQSPVYHEEEPVHPAYHEPEPEPVAAVSQEGAPAAEEAPRYGDWRDEVPAEELAEPSPTFASESQVAQEQVPPFDDGADRYAHELAPASQGEAETPTELRNTEELIAEPQPQQPAWEPEQAEAAPVTKEDWAWQEQDEKRPAGDAEAAWNDVPDFPLQSSGPSVPIPAREPVEAHFVEETAVAADSVRMPPVSDFPDLQAPAAQAAPATEPVYPVADDPFAPAAAAEPQAKDARKEEGDPWADLEELIGYNKDAPFTGGAAPGPLATESKKSDEPPAKAYRVTPKKKRNYTGMMLGILGLFVVFGGAYALWLNRDALNDMVSAFVEPGPPGTETPVAEDVPATPAPAAGEPETSNGNGATAPAPDDGSVAGTKFTQRLMQDGTEVDEGPGGAAAGGAEGQSVAALNAPPASADPAQPSGGPVAAGASPAGTTPAANREQGAAPAENAPAPSANPADAPALAGEKMFLYEERLGQTAPTAVEGAVSWSLQREPGANGAEEPVVQGRIDIPGRGLTALVTFKRNSDPSLPASHLIEIVFSVPPEFEGGAIDSVQRIALKQTEQDRGNALIAVPAKITDDFHMIALNDFPDARATNLELLRSREWMDIPLAYRNGRRALLTLQKGPAGVQAFNDAIREWAALGDSPSSQ